MTMNAVCMMVITLGGVWGGFIALIIKLQRMPKD